MDKNLTVLIRSQLTLKTDRDVLLPKAYTIELVKRLYDRLGLPFQAESVPAIACSGLLGPYRMQRDFFCFAAEEPYQLAISGLNGESARAIANLELSSLAFLGAEFATVDRADETASYETLYGKWVASEPEPLQRFDMYFGSPTAFSQGNVTLPLPLPELMFRSWLERWNHFAPVYLGGDELIAHLKQGLQVQRHQVRSQQFQVGQGFVTGFVGSVSLRLLRRVEPLVGQVAGLLAAYGRFAGTGIKTRLGMGYTDWQVGDRGGTHPNPSLGRA